MNSDLSIVVNSCDTYSDLWVPFFTLFKKYWPDCGYPIVLNTEHKDFKFDGLNIDVINLPNGHRAKSTKYGERLKNVLRKIHSEYVLILLDDFFIRSKVRSDIIEECKKWMNQDPDIALISFESVSDTLNNKAENHPDFVLRPKYGEYKINLQAGLWRKEHLLKHIRDYESPWDFELLGNLRTFSSSLKYYALDSESNRVINYRVNDGRYPYKWSVVGGKWVVDTVSDLFKNNGLSVDFNDRGIYTDEDFANEKSSSITYSSSQLLKSLGLILYFKIFRWGYVRKIAYLLFRNELPNSYIEYKRNKLATH